MKLSIHIIQVLTNILFSTYSASIQQRQIIFHLYSQTLLDCFVILRQTYFSIFTFTMYLALTQVDPIGYHPNIISIQIGKFMKNRISKTVIHSSPFYWTAQNNKKSLGRIILLSPKLECIIIHVILKRHMYSYIGKHNELLKEKKKQF